MAEHIVAFGRTNTIAPATVSPRRASSRKSSRILITPGSTRTEARIPSRLRLMNFAPIAIRPCGEALTAAFERRFDSCMASIPFVISFGVVSAKWVAGNRSTGRTIWNVRGDRTAAWMPARERRRICRNLSTPRRPNGDLRHSVSTASWASGLIRSRRWGRIGSRPENSKPNLRSIVVNRQAGRLPLQEVFRRQRSLDRSERARRIA